MADDNLEIAQMASERQQRASLERRRSADRGAPVRFIVDVEICTTRTTNLTSCTLHVTLAGPTELHVGEFEELNVEL